MLLCLIGFPTAASAVVHNTVLEVLAVPGGYAMSNFIGTAKLRDTDLGNALVLSTKTISIVFGTTTINAITELGVATVTFTAPVSSGTYYYTATFSGDTDYNYSQNNSTVIVSPRPTSIQPFSGDGTMMTWGAYTFNAFDTTAFILDSLDGNNGIAGLTLEFNVQTTTITGVSQASPPGRAISSTQFPSTGVAGSYPVQVTFNGNQTYAASVLLGGVDQSGGKRGFVPVYQSPANIAMDAVQETYPDQDTIITGTIHDGYLGDRANARPVLKGTQVRYRISDTACNPYPVNCPWGTLSAPSWGNVNDSYIATATVHSPPAAGDYPIERRFNTTSSFYYWEVTEDSRILRVGRRLTHIIPDTEPIVVYAQQPIKIKVKLQDVTQGFAGVDGKTLQMVLVSTQTPVTGSAGIGYVESTFPGMDVGTYTYIVRFLEGDVVYMPYESTGTVVVEPPIVSSAVSTLGYVGVSSSSITLSWTAPGYDGDSGILNNSTFTIQYATYTSVAWSTTSAQINIATTAVIPGTPQYHMQGGLSTNTSYYFRLWTKNIFDNYSPLSNGATVATLIEAPTSVYFDEVGTASIIVSAYAPVFTGLERGVSGVNIASSPVYDMWGSTGNYWTAKLPMLTARQGPAAAAIGGRLYVVGGTSDGINYLNINEEYDPVTNNWTTKTGMGTSRYLLAAGAINGKLYAVGGYSNPGGIRSTNEEYDPVTNAAWILKAPMPTARERLAAGVAGGKLYAIGGNNSGVKDNNEAYDPATNSWAIRKTMTTPRDRLAVGAINGKIYAVGGDSFGELGTNEEYDPATNLWAPKAAMPTPRSSLAAGAIGGKLYAVAGYAGGYPAANEAYDAATDTWTVKTAIPAVREGSAAGVINGKLYIAGGHNGSSYLNTNQEYKPGVTSVFAGLKPNTQYTFKAKARNLSGVEGGESVPISTYTMATATMPASGQPISNVYVSSLTVTWSSGTEAGGYNGPGASYKVLASTAPNFSGDISYYFSPASLSLTLDSLLSNTTYYFRVQAYNTGGITDHSWTLLGSTKTAMPPPPGVIVSTVGAALGDFGLQKGLVRDSHGDLYFAYLKLYNGKRRVFLARSADDGATWADTTVAPIETAGDVPAVNSYDQDSPALAIDSHDVLHLVWGGTNNVLDSVGGAESKCVYSSAPVPGASWYPYVKIPAHSYGGPESEFSIAADSKDGLHIVWSGQDSGGLGSSRIRYSSSTGMGPWGAYAEVNNEGFESDGPALAIDSQDGVHIVLKHAIGAGTYNTPSIVYSSRSASGAWGAWTTIFNDAGGAHQESPALTIDSSGKLIAVWNSADAVYSNSQIKYSIRPAGGSWSALLYPQVIPEAPQRSPRVASDAQGNTYLVWSGSNTANPVVNIKAAMYDGLGWSAWENVSAGLQPQQFPRLRWSGWRNNGGGLDLVWNDYNGVSSTATIRALHKSDIFLSPGWAAAYWPRPEGCGNSVDVKQDGTANYTGIQAAVDSLSANISTTTCIVIRDTQTYSEQVTVDGFTNNNYRLKIMGDPTFTSSAPAVNPPVGSSAGFRIANASVSVQGINIISTNTVAYGIFSSSVSVNISSVNVISGGKINGVGVLISSYSSVSCSSITVQNAYGLMLTGLNSQVSFSTMTGSYYLKGALYIFNSDFNAVTQSYIHNPAGHSASLGAGADYNTISYSTITSNAGYETLILSNSSSNTITRSFISNPSGNGVYLADGSYYNNILDSTMTSNTADFFALAFVNSASNTVTRSYISNPLGNGAGLWSGANYNTISNSTMTSNAVGNYALSINGSSSNTILGSYIQGSTAAYITNSTGTSIGGSVFAATYPLGYGLRFAGGNVNLALSSSTFIGGAQGGGIYFDSYNSGGLNLSSNTVSGGKYGLNIATQGAGAVLSVSSMTFNSLTAGATAINFLGGQFVSTFTSVNFGASGISVNVNALPLASGSRVTMRSAAGQKSGAAYENDTANYVEWKLPLITSLTANPVIISTGASSIITCAASDPDNYALAYEWSLASGVIVGSGSQVTWVAPVSSGPYTISCAVSDGMGGSAQKNLNINVTTWQNNLGGEIVFYDDFSSATIDTSKWQSGGNSVTQASGILTLSADVTDAMGWVKTEKLGLSKMAMRVRHWMAPGSAYFGPEISFRDDNGDNISSLQFKKSSYAPDYCSDGAKFNRVLLYTKVANCLVVGAANSDTYYSRWTETYISYDAKNGDIVVDLDTDGVIDLNYNIPTTDRRPVNHVYIKGWGWWTGHLHKLDYIVINATETTTSAILEPPDNSYKSSLPQIYGTAFDIGGISGAAINIKRADNNKYWDGGTWTANNPVWLTAAVDPSSWTYTSPAWADGSVYTIVAKARNIAGSWSTNYSTSTFNYKIFPPGCGPNSKNAGKDRKGDSLTIQGAIDMVPSPLTADTCVIIRDTQTYSEQVAAGLTTSGYRLTIMADPAYVSSAPAVNPPLGSSAAFRLISDSVTVQGVNVISTSAVQYGVWALGAFDYISSVNVVSGDKIAFAGINITGSSCTVAYSSITVQSAEGLQLSGSGNTVSFSTITTSGNNTHALYVNNGDYNTFTHTYMSALVGNAAFLTANADYNTISDSTMTGNTGSYAGLYILTSSSNIIERSYLSNPSGNAAIVGNAKFNTISDSTITSNGEGYSALFLSVSSATTVSRSYIQGSTGAFINSSSGTIINSSVFVATSPAGYGIRFTKGGMNLSISSSTFFGGPQGAGIYLDVNNSGSLLFSSNTISGGQYGLNIATQGTGSVLSISSMTFSSLTTGATAINFLGGTFVSTFTGVGFNSANIAVNVNGSYLTAGSRVIVRRAAGGKSGPDYESDTYSYVDWPGVVVSLVEPVDGLLSVSQSPGLHVRAADAAGPVQFNYQLDTLDTMDSQGVQPLHNFNQNVSQSFANVGAFSGQDGTISVSSDSYLYNSTATLVFYSTGTSRLSPNAKYYWRVRAKTAETGYFGIWSATASFTTGEAAAETPVNNLAVTNVSLSSATGLGATINFTIRENNVSTGTSPNGGNYNTADWIFIKFSTQAGADGTWNHATLAAGGVGAGGAMAVASDKKGVFVNHTANYALWQATASVVWNYSADGVTAANARVKVFALSMVKVPQGPFVYNVGNIGGSDYSNFGGGVQATVNSVNDIPAVAAAGWPNGYNSFYIGRYEITQGQYADYLNTVWSSTAAVLHSATVANGHNITNIGSYPLKYAAADRNAAKNYLSVADAWSYLSWAGLRPPTEMEFEKAGRDINGDTRTYPWGNTAPGTATYTPPNEGGTCIGKFLNYNSTAGCLKVLDVGRYMSGDLSRTPEETGVSPWGITDLAGNEWEIILNCSYTSIPANGNGTVYWPTGWPEPGSAFPGLRGGGWFDNAAVARVSSRSAASWPFTYRSNNQGARGARTP